MIAIILMVILPVFSVNGEINQESPVQATAAGDYVDNFTTTTYESPSSTAGGWGLGKLHNHMNYSVEHLDFYPTIHPAMGLAVQGRKAYVVCNNKMGHQNSFYGFNINDPRNIELMSYRNSLEAMYTCEAYGNVLYAGAQTRAVGSAIIAAYNITYPYALDGGAVFGDFALVYGQVTDIDIEGPLVHYTLYKATDGYSLKMLYTEEPYAVRDITKDWANDNALGLEVEGGLLYVAASTEGLYIFNSSIDRTPVFVDQVNTPGNATDVIIKNNIAIVADGNAGIQLVNITEPTTSTIISSHDLTGNARRMILHEDTLFVAAEEGGLKLLDISDVNYPVLFDEVLTDEIVYDVDLFGGIVVVTTDQGIHTFRIAPGNGVENIANRVMPNPFTMYKAVDVCVIGDIAYVVGGTDGFYTVDVSDPANPILLDRYSNPSYNIRKLDVNGFYAYCVLHGGILIFEVHDPKNIRFLNAIPGGGLTDLEIRGDILFVGYTSGFAIVNVSDPYDFTVIIDFSTTIHNNITAIYVDGPHLYCVEGAGGAADTWACYDITDYLNPKLTYSATRTAGLYDVIVDGDSAYLGAGGWMAYYNVSNPFAIDYLDWESTTSVGVSNFGPYVFSAELDYGIAQYNVSIDSLSTIGRAWSVQGGLQLEAHGDYLYVANQTALVILQHYTSPGSVYLPGSAEAISLAVDTVDNPDHITAATLTADTYMPPGTDLHFMMSADGGTNWEMVTPGVVHNFTDTGHELLWKAIFYGSMHKTAYINNIAINYNYTINIAPTGAGGPPVISSSVIGVLALSTITMMMVITRRKKNKD
jgi:hypothetical protein